MPAASSAMRTTGIESPRVARCPPTAARMNPCVAAVRVSTAPFSQAGQVGKRAMQANWAAHLDASGKHCGNAVDGGALPRFLRSRGDVRVCSWYQIDTLTYHLPSGGTGTKGNTIRCEAGSSDARGQPHGHGRDALTAGRARTRSRNASAVDVQRRVE